jgi:hypothetical protein
MVAVTWAFCVHWLPLIWQTQWSMLNIAQEILTLELRRYLYYCDSQSIITLVQICRIAAICHRHCSLKWRAVPWLIVMIQDSRWRSEVVVTAWIKVEVNHWGAEVSDYSSGSIYPRGNEIHHWCRSATTCLCLADKTCWFSSRRPCLVITRFSELMAIFHYIGACRLVQAIGVEVLRSLGVKDSLVCCCLCPVILFLVVTSSNTLLACVEVVWTGSKY